MSNYRRWSGVDRCLRSGLVPLDSAAERVQFAWFSSQESSGDALFEKSSAKTSESSGRVVHCKKEPFDVYIGRPSKWGNPFSIGQDGDRETVIEKYRQYILSRPDLLSDLHELRGKVLGCWCSPKACHGDVLLELINKI